MPTYNLMWTDFVLLSFRKRRHQFFSFTESAEYLVLRDQTSHKGGNTFLWVSYPKTRDRGQGMKFATQSLSLLGLNLLRWSWWKNILFLSVKCPLFLQVGHLFLVSRPGFSKVYGRFFPYLVAPPHADGRAQINLIFLKNESGSHQKHFTISG